MAVASVLVVDDDVAAAAWARAVLSAAGYAVFNVRCGQLGLQRVMASAPDVVITAILMPDGDGIELITAVKSWRREILIMAVSDRRFLGGLDLFDLATKLGADAVLAKPLDGETLLATVAALLTWRGEPRGQGTLHAVSGRRPPENC